MRHIAWLNATPEGQDKTRRSIVSAAQQELIELDEYEQHLVKLWREVGSTSQGGTGVAPLVWGEIIEWANHFYSQHIVAYVEGCPVVIKKCTLEDYELEIIMQLSREYCQEYYEASDPNRECPKEIFLDEVDSMQNADAILEMFQKNWGSQRESLAPEIVR